MFDSRTLTDPEIREIIKPLMQLSWKSLAHVSDADVLKSGRAANVSDQRTALLYQVVCTKRIFTDSLFAQEVYTRFVTHGIYTDKDYQKRLLSNLVDYGLEKDQVWDMGGGTHYIIVGVGNNKRCVTTRNQSSLRVATKLRELFLHAVGIKDDVRFNSRILQFNQITQIKTMPNLWEDMKGIPDPILEEPKKPEYLIDNQGRKVKPPELPLEVYNDKPIDTDKAWEEIKRACN